MTPDSDAQARSMGNALKAISLFAFIPAALFFAHTSSYLAKAQRIAAESLPENIELPGKWAIHADMFFRNNFLYLAVLIVVGLFFLAPATFRSKGRFFVVLNFSIALAVIIYAFVVRAAANSMIFTTLGEFRFSL